MKQEEKNFSLKDQLFSKENITYLCVLLKKAYTPLEQKQLEKDILAKIPELELKEVIAHIADCIQKHIPQNYRTLIQTLTSSVSEGDYGANFVFAAYSHIVAEKGCNKQDLAFSLEALGEFTKYFSAEFAIRNFLNAFPQETLSQCQKWTTSNNTDQRRLASEGTRPKLPWAKAITIEYQEAIEILNTLYKDSERYVTRSVANHLNDISKIDPSLVITTLKQWHKDKKQNKEELTYITKHALRTLLKQGNAEALQLLGFKQTKHTQVKAFSISESKFSIPHNLILNCTLESTKEEALLIKYTITYPNGGSKVFHWKELTITANKIQEIQKKHPFKLMTTKALPEGEYKIALQINGVERDYKTFTIIHT